MVKSIVYIPLGGNRKGKARTYCNLLLIFFLSGAWHGASWNYIIWGMLHGSVILSERLFLGQILKKAPNFVQHLYTIFIFAMGWLIFRFEDLSLLQSVLTRIFDITQLMKSFTNTDLQIVYIYLNWFYGGIFVIGIFFCTDIYLKFQERMLKRTNNKYNYFETIVLYGLFLFSCYMLYQNTAPPFLYFQF